MVTDAQKVLINAIANFVGEKVGPVVLVVGHGDQVTTFTNGTPIESLGLIGFAQGRIYQTLGENTPNVKGGKHD